MNGSLPHIPRHIQSPMQSIRLFEFFDFDLHQQERNDFGLNSSRFMTVPLPLRVKNIQIRECGLMTISSLLY